MGLGQMHSSGYERAHPRVGTEHHPTRAVLCFQAGNNAGESLGIHRGDRLQ